MNEKLWWYVARSTGIVAWALVAAAVIWGLLLTTRLVGGRSAPKWLLDLHRFLGALAVTFTGLHLVGLVADSYTHFGPTDLLVPFASSWKPAPVALGVVAMYLLVAVELTSLAMRRIPRRLWRWVHLTSFGSFWLATLHGVLAGTDASNPLLWLTYLVTASVVVFLTVFRTLADPRTPRRAGSVAPAAPAAPGAPGAGARSGATPDRVQAPGSGHRRPAATTASSMTSTSRAADPAQASSASGPSSSTRP